MFCFFSDCFPQCLPVNSLLNYELNGCCLVQIGCVEAEIPSMKDICPWNSLTPFNRKKKRGTVHHLHGRSKRSGWSGFGPTTFSQTQLARCMRTLNTRTYASRRPRPAFHCLQAVRVLPATESWAGAWGTTTTHSLRNVNQNPVCLWSQLRSDFQANSFLLRGHAFHM